MNPMIRGITPYQLALVPGAVVGTVAASALSADLLQEPARSAWLGLGDQQVPRLNPDLLDFSRGTGVMSAASKFVLPVGSPKDAEPLVYPLGHAKAGEPITDYEEKPLGERGIVFVNHKDGSTVGAQVGDGIIIINEVNEEQAELIYTAMCSGAPWTGIRAVPGQLTVQHLKDLLEALAKEGLRDRYNSAVEFARTNLTPARPDARYSWQVGGAHFGFVKRDGRDIKPALWVDGPFVFDGKFSQDQILPLGGIIVGGGVDHAIQPDAFIRTYRMADGSEIQVDA